MTTQTKPLSGAERMSKAEAAIEELSGRLHALSLDAAHARRRIAALESFVSALQAAVPLNSAYDRWEQTDKARKIYEASIAD